MKKSSIIILAAMGLANIGLIIPAVSTTVVGLSPKEAEVEEEEEISGVTSVKIINQPNKTVYQEGEEFNVNGLLCLVTQNGAKKMVKNHFEVLLDRPLQQGDTNVQVKYGEITINIPVTVITFNSILDINRNGSYVVQAEDNRIPIEGYIEADPAWSAAHYDGTNPTTKFVENWTNTRCTPSSGKSLANVKVGSVLGFKFTVAKPCKINVNASMAMYDTMKPSDLLTFRLDGEVKDDVDKSLVLTHLDAQDAGGKYFNWQNWSMGTYAVDAGNHVFTITVDTFKLPNLDYFKIIATEMEGGDLVNINNNGSFFLNATNEAIDRTGWITDGSSNDVIENWNNSQATDVSELSGQSIGHLGNGCQIVFPVALAGRAHVDVYIYAATPNNYKAKDSLGVKFGATEPSGAVDVTLASGRGSTYWNWTKFKAGSIDLAKGSYVVTVNVKKAVNLLKYEFVASNYESGAYGAATVDGNGTKIVQLESGYLDRTMWSVRSDFVQAGRQPIEDWTTSHQTEISESSGQSLAGINAGCVIEIPFETKNRATVSLNVVAAFAESINASTAITVKVDGHTLENPDQGKYLGPAGTANNGQRYWNWKVYDAGNYVVEAGEHKFSVTLNNGVNVDSFRIVTTNYGA